tara:strand:- start:66 stop:824 length:759 start_codon:yes stop_codon:yes gene_type:complete
MAIKCEELIYTPINAISFMISGGVNMFKEHLDTNNNIVSLESPKNNFITGDCVEINNIRYKINFIQKITKNKIKAYEIFSSKRTKSSNFILPMIGGDRKLLFWDRLFVNCYIENDDTILLVYRISLDPMFIRFQEALEKFKFLKEVRFPHPEYIIFAFSVPTKYNRDFNHFINGRYSQFSNDYKLKILDFHFLDMEGQTAQILFKASIRKKQLEETLGCILEEESELLSIIDPEKETFDIKMYADCNKYIEL